MVNSPAAVKGYLAMNSALATGVLPFAVRERISIVSAEYNDCTYCLSAHTFAGGRFGNLSEAELEAARDATSEDPHVEAILELALAILQGRGQGGEAAIRAALGGGVTQEEISEVVANIALNVMTNYFNELVGTEVDYPLVHPHAR